MTSKEALEELKDYLIKPINKSSEFNEWVIEIYDTIKQDLERKEQLEKENKELKEKYKHRAETSHELCEALKNYEKAIEIIKLTKVDTLLLLRTKSLKEYNSQYELNKLTQQEYELIKEVLGNERLVDNIIPFYRSI